MKSWLPILMLTTVTTAWAQSETAICSWHAAPAGQAGVQITAVPGEYTLLTSTNLQPPAPWNAETNFTIGEIGTTNTAIPFLGRAMLFLRATGFATSTGSLFTAQFRTVGSLFSPEIGTDEATLESLLWTWSDNSTSSNHPEATKDFGSAEERLQSLSVEPAAALTAINLGFDESDGGDITPLPLRDPQNVSAVIFPTPLPGLRYFAASYNPITNTLNFAGCTNLETIECFESTTLQHVVLTNLPALRRVCLEDADLQELDLSGNPALEDLRGALNAYTEIIVDRGTGPNLWHWCTRDNPQLTQSFQTIMTNFFALQELFIWNDNQAGHLSLVSTNLISVLDQDNRYTSADFTDKTTLRDCILSGNQLTNLVLAGCSGLQILDARHNRLPADVLDALLSLIDTSMPIIYNVDLSQNAGIPSDTGYTHYSNLVARGVTISVDWPHMNDGLTNAPGGTNAITFVTTTRNPHMEIQTDHGSPTNFLWHWGDGRIDQGVWVADHDLGAEGVYTNYVEVQPPETVSYFGAEQGFTNQGIQAVYNASNFPALATLYLYQESLGELSLAGCTNLTQLHLADNPVSTATCDQWFLDLDAAVPGPVTNADFFYPASLPSSASATARSNLVTKGYTLHPL